LAPEFQRVTAVPDVMSMKLIEGDFLLLACDGIYENQIFTQESVCTWIHTALANPSFAIKDGPDLAMVVARLLDTCLLRGSTDNMTAILIQLANGDEYNAKPEYIPGPFYYGEGDSQFREAYKEDAAKSGVSLESALELLARRLEKKQQDEEVALLKSIRLSGEKGELINVPTNAPNSPSSTTSTTTTEVTTSTTESLDLATSPETPHLHKTIRRTKTNPTTPHEKEKEKEKEREKEREKEKEKENLGGLH